MIKTDKNLSIVIYSCYKNKDMWQAFSFFFQKFWNDCPFKVVLLTDKFDDAVKYTGVGI